MSFNRLKDDICEKKQHVKESVGPGQYRLNQPLNCGACYQNNPSIILQKSGVSQNGNYDWRFYNGPVDVESELRNLTRPASRCPTKKYLPKCPKCGSRSQGMPSGADVSSLCKQCKPSNPGKQGENIVDFPDCHFPVEHTRLEKSIPRGVGLNRFEYPCKDPQANIFFPGKWRVCSRTMMRDNYRPCFRKPAINDMTP